MDVVLWCHYINMTYNAISNLCIGRWLMQGPLSKSTIVHLSICIKIWKVHELSHLKCI